MFSMAYEGRLANFYQGLSQERESQDTAVPATISGAAVPAADEWGALAGRRRASLADAADDGVAEIPGQSRPCWRRLTSLGSRHYWRGLERFWQGFYQIGAVRPGSSLFSARWPYSPWRHADTPVPAQSRMALRQGSIRRGPSAKSGSTSGPPATVLGSGV